MLRNTTLPVLAFLCSVMLIPQFSFAQGDDLKRVEFEVDNDERVKFITLEERGALTMLYGDEEEKKNLIWSVQRWNENLERMWSADIKVDEDHDFQEAFVDEGFLYFYTKGKTSKKQQYGFFKMNLKDGTYVHFYSIMPYAQIGATAMANNSIYLGGSTMLTPGARIMRTYLSLCLCYIPMCFGVTADPMEVLVYRADFDRRKLTLMPSTFEHRGSPVSLSVQDEGKEIVGAFSLTPKGKAKPSMVLRRFDDSNSKMQDAELKTGATKVPINAKIKDLEGGKELIIGTYYETENLSWLQRARQNLSKKATGRGLNAATGMFFSEATNGKQRYVKFYDFAEFESFYRMVSEKLQKRIEKKSKKKRDRAETTLSSYQLLFHDIEQVGEEYIVVAEAYFPEYHTETYTTVNSDGSTSTSTRQVFDGFRYTHCIIASFSEEGELLWENAFKIQDILTFDLKERVRFLVSGLDLVFAYNYGGAIQSTVIRKGEVASSKTGTKIDTGSEDEKLKSISDSDLFYWYDNYFLATGAQRIKSELSRKERKKQDLDKKRTVYYMNKIVFD